MDIKIPVKICSGKFLQFFGESLWKTGRKVKRVCRHLKKGLYLAV